MLARLNELRTTDGELRRGWASSMSQLGELQDARDWRGIVARERTLLALARGRQDADPGSGLPGAIHGVLGQAFEGVGQYARACEMHEQHKAMAEALGDRAGVATACGNLGICYYSAGDYGRAREMHEQDKAIVEELGDRAGVARACTNLGKCYDSTGDYGRAREMHEQAKAIFEELGDRARVATWREREREIVHRQLRACLSAQARDWGRLGQIEVD